MTTITPQLEPSAAVWERRSLGFVLSEATERLAASNVDSGGHIVENPKVVAELIAAHILGCRRFDLYLKLASELDEEQIHSLADAVDRVAGGEPLQYLLGTVDFMGYTFKVDYRALIPRPETEVLVERVLDCRSLWKRNVPCIADVGTGCGVIAATLALFKPAASYTAVDISGEALSLAEENVCRHGVTNIIRFVRSDLLAGFKEASFDAVIANLPYVRTSEYAVLDAAIRDHEPRIALDGGIEGLDMIARLVERAPACLRNSGYLFLEIAADQARAVTCLLASAGFGSVAVSKDLGGRDRVVSACLQGSCG